MRWRSQANQKTRDLTGPRLVPAKPRRRFSPVAAAGLSHAHSVGRIERYTRRRTARVVSVSPTYWLDLFTVETWREFIDQGRTVTGFRESRWKTVQKIKPGDFLLCYLTQSVSRWVGVLEVTGEPYWDEETRIWSSDVFPARLPVKPIVTVTPEQGVSVLSMRDELTVFENLANPNLWSGAFRGSPSKWKTSDGTKVLTRLQAAAANPTDRPFKARPNRYLKQRDEVRAAKEEPTATHTHIDEASAAEEHDPAEAAVAGKPERAHTEMQYLLMRLGDELNLTVYVARNDRKGEWNGQRLEDLPGQMERLPDHIGLDPKTNRETVRFIDVLWLDKAGRSVQAAFEVESTTSIYSGLLRMSDLLATYPNLSIPLFVVAPEVRRDAVMREVQRPTFERMATPLGQVVRYIPFEGLREAMDANSAVLPYLNIEWLQSISESCEAGDED